jgi:phage baseplate assembly protein W
MLGMNASTGAAIEGEDHLAQSVGDILSTPIATRIMRRDYGSLLFELVDAPTTPSTLQQVYAAVALALHRWEPRLRLTRVAVALGATPSEVEIGIEGYRTDQPGPNSFARLTVPLRLSALPA